MGLVPTKREFGLSRTLGRRGRGDLPCGCETNSFPEPCDGHGGPVLRSGRLLSSVCPRLAETSAGSTRPTSSPCLPFKREEIMMLTVAFQTSHDRTFKPFYL